jgi:Fe2+ transport system protein FeoA
MENAKITLESLAPGQSARVLALELPPAEAQRLMEMGMTPGSTVKVLKRAPLGDPIEIFVRSGHLSIRNSIARAITVNLA